VKQRAVGGGQLGGGGSKGGQAAGGVANLRGAGLEQRRASDGGGKAGLSDGVGDWGGSGGYGYVDTSFSQTI
jgi:hypothetical protein